MNIGSAACPDCGSPLGPGSVARCPQCRLPLLGQDAVALWQVTTALGSLDVQRQSLLRQRDHLLAGLRARRDLPDPPPLVPAFPPAFPPATPHEVSGPSAQTVLLTLGGLLVGVAALVFTVVSWGQLGIGGRALVLVAVTLCALLPPAPLRRRALTATAETSAAIGLALVLLDCYAAHAVGFAGLDRLGAAAYWAGATALTAAAAAAYGKAVGLRGPLMVALALAQLPTLLVAVAVGGSVTDFATAVLLTALADLALATRTSALPLTVAGTGWALLGSILAGAWATTAGTAADAQLAWLPLALVTALGLSAALAPAAALPVLTSGPRCAAAALAGTALLAGLGGSLRFAFPSAWTPAGYAVPGALLALAAVHLLTTTAPRYAPALLGLLGAGTAVLALSQLPYLPALLAAFFGPIDQWTAAWSPDHGRPHDVAWTLAPAPLVLLGLLVAVLALAAVRCTRTGHRDAARTLHRFTLGLGAPAVLLLPAACRLPLPAGVVWAVLLSIGTTAVLLRRPADPFPAFLVLLPTATAAVLWAGSDRVTTIVVWSVLAALTALLTTTLPEEWAVVTAAATVLDLGVVAVAAGTTAGLALHQCAFALLAVSALSVPVAAWLAARPGRRAVAAPVEVSGYALGGVAVLLTLTHPLPLSLALSVAGVLAFGVALRRDRRQAALVGTALLILASWVRLALAEVTAPEPYTAGVALAALIVGHLRHRRDPALPSWSTYGPGLTTALLPSLIATWADPHWLRPLLLGTLTLALTLLGARLRLQAPLLLGGGTLLLVAVHELAPLLVQILGVLPRWVPLAATGLLLLLLGATYEQRLRDARRARDSLRRLG